MSTSLGNEIDELRRQLAEERYLRAEWMVQQEPVALNKLHSIICEAVTYLNGGDSISASTVLRQSLVDFADAAPVAKSVEQDCVSVPRVLLLAARMCVQEMRDENKLHGHITDASAKWAIRIEPELNKALAASKEPQK